MVTPRLAWRSSGHGEELKDIPIGVHTISPGMVFTDSLERRYAFGSQGRLFVNAFEPADSTAELIVEKLKEALARPVNRTIAIKI